MHKQFWPMEKLTYVSLLYSHYVYWSYRQVKKAHTWLLYYKLFIKTNICLQPSNNGLYAGLYVIKT